MKIIKALLLAVALLIPAISFAEMDSEDQVIYTQALRDGDVKLVKKYLDSGVGANDLYFAWSALQIAANQGKIEVIKLLLDKGADINARHPITKLTAFHLAAYENFPEVVKFLAARGADVNLKMRADVSIIRGIRDTGNTKMVELLTSLGVKDDGCMEEKCL